MPLFSGKCYSKVRLVGKTVVITGCNTGIGKENVLDFYRRGAHVLMACRDLSRAEAAMNDVKKKCEGEEGLGSIVVTKLDLSSLTSVRQCVKHILETEPKIHILVNNAGIMMCSKSKTEDGFEMQIGTNHFAHYLFTLLLLPRIIQSKPARIVNVSSIAHETGSIDFEDMFFENRSYSAWGAYAQSKLANILFTTELAKKLKENNIEGVNVYALHPGAVNTDLQRHMDNTYFTGARFMLSPLKLFFKSAETGAHTTTYCSVDEKCANETGLYYSDCVVKRASKKARDSESAEKLWNISWDLVKLGNWNPFTTENNEF